MKYPIICWASSKNGVTDRRDDGMLIVARLLPSAIMKFIQI